MIYSLSSLENLSYSKCKVFLMIAGDLFRSKMKFILPFNQKKKLRKIKKISTSELLIRISVFRLMNDDSPI